MWLSGERYIRKQSKLTTDYHQSLKCDCHLGKAESYIGGQVDKSWSIKFRYQVLDLVAWSSWSARQSVTLEVAGSSPVVTAIATIGVVNVWLPFR